MCSEIGIGNAQLASSSQPSLLDHVHSKEADILAISELNCDLDKKVYNPNHLSFSVNFDLLGTCIV